VAASWLTWRIGGSWLPLIGAFDGGAQIHAAI